MKEIRSGSGLSTLVQVWMYATEPVTRTDPEMLLYRILEAAKIRSEPKRALSEQNERGLFLGTGGEALQGVSAKARYL